MKEHQQIITGCGLGEIAPHGFVCGDPARIPKVSRHWDQVREVCRVREFVIHTGEYRGVPMTVASTGIGAPSTAIVLEELANLGLKTVIRIGNSGALSPRVALGDYVITSASIRDEGTTASYVDAAYPAAAHYQVVAALVEAARNQDAVHHVGLTWSVDGFYARNKVLDPKRNLQTMCHGGYSQSWMNDLVEDRRRAGVLNVEMESSTVLTLASLFGLRAGCICTVSDQTPWPGPGQDALSLDKNIDGAIAVALEAMHQLSRAE